MSDIMQLSGLTDRATSKYMRASYAETPKYRCPGCQTQTCSLPCYKKHQQRASCSGKRDPAAYLKKSRLATPAGLDRDFNYLKGVERSINHAGFEVEGRGIGVGSASNKNVAKGWQAHGRLQEYLTKHHITLERAPKGMSRQKANTTRSTKGGHIMWTVEWATANGISGLQHDCPESSSLQNLYAAHRKAAGVGETQRQRPVKRQKTCHDGQAADRNVPANETNGTEHGVDTPASDGAQTAAREKAKEVVTTQTTQDNHATSPPSQHTASHDLSENSTTPAHHFYLLRPATASSSKVLIPVKPEMTLTQSLGNQMVQEYPTIYVLETDPELLSDGFITEASYLAMRGKEEKELQGMERSVTGDSLKQGGEPEAEELDAQSILKMLMRDVNR